MTRAGLSSKSLPAILRLAALFFILAYIAARAAPRPADFWVGLPLVLAGAGVRMWAAGYLLKSNELAVRGPYAFTRNPLYLGRLLLFTGFVLMARLPLRLNLALGLAGYAVFFFYYLPRKERVEGERLEERHGEAFRRYRAAVPALFPRPIPYRDPQAAPQSSGWISARFLRNQEYLMLLLEGGLLVLFGARALL
ncbi:MAG: methyltransferase family protein [Acidobacteriota bacterium]